MKTYLKYACDKDVFIFFIIIFWLIRTHVGHFILILVSSTVYHRLQYLLRGESVKKTVSGHAEGKKKFYFDVHMVHRIYPAELQLNKANGSDTEAAFLDLNLSIHNDIFSTKIYDKRDDFNFDIVNFPFLDGDVPQRPSYGVYISQLIRFARASSHITDFNNRNKFYTAKFLKQGYRYHKLRKAFSKFYRRHFELIEKFHVSLKKFMQQGICNPEFYGDLVYKFKKIIGNPNFSNLLKRIVNRFKRAGYSLDIMRQTACLVFNPIMVKGYAALFSCTAVV